MHGRPITTVRDFEAHGWTITPHCSHHYVCTHFSTLPIEYLAAHLGWDFDLYDSQNELLRRLTCSRCGWHYPEIRIATQQNRRIAAGSGAGHAHGDAMPFEEALRRSLEMRAEWRARGEPVSDGGYKRRR